MLHKVRRSGEPESLATQFVTTIERDDHIRSTRQDHLLSLPRIRGSAAGKRQFVYRAATDYNDLPRDFLDMSMPIFAKNVRQLLSDVT